MPQNHTSMPIIAPQRNLFSIPEDVAYFNCAYLGPQLIDSQNRLISGVIAKNHPWERLAPNFFDMADEVRVLAAQVLGGDAEGWAVVPAASYALSAAARAVEPTLQPGDRIVVMAEEFPSHVLPWKRSAAERGATQVTVPVPDDGDWTRALLGAIDERTRVVAASPCHWTNGARIDLAPIAAAARARGAVLALDATQALGAMPIDFAALQPDFVAAAGYKWLLAPYGFSLLHVAPRWRDARPLEESWLARDKAEDFAGLVRISDTYMPGARRFDGGEKCTPTILPGAIAALEQIRAWGVANIAASLAAINTEIAAQLERLGCRLPPAERRCPHLFGARVPEGFDRNLVAELRKRQIYVSQRGDSLRFAPHLHVNRHDVERLLRALAELIA
jgi:selenocysteine lyase/cysteine desulfurase